VDGHLRTLIDLQVVDSRIAGLESEAGKLPAAIAAVHAGIDGARKAVEDVKTRVDAARKSQRAKEQALEDNRIKRQKFEGQLYQVKTNKEYSAVLAEIEEVKQEKSRIEEEILVLMESHERLAVELKDAEARFKERESRGKDEEAELQERLRAADADLEVVKRQRADLAGQVAPAALTDYDKLLRHRGTAIVEVAKPNFCGGCRVTITPQRLQLLRQQNILIHCESCGRYLYWTA
jgi:predicted  nucleic acid-binding Zn-ribbon protein